MKLQHKTILSKIEVDFLNGIFSSNFGKKKIPWEEIVSVFKYSKPGIFIHLHVIDLAYQETDGSIYYGNLLKTGNKFKCLHFCEKIVDHLKNEYGALGGSVWCARLLNKSGKLDEKSTLLQAYVICRMIADKMNIKWFEHTDDEEVEAVISFLKSGLKRDGTEEKQIIEVINSTRFQIQKDGSANLYSSSGYRLLEDVRIKISSEKAR